MNVRNLTAKLGLDTSGFKRNSEEVKKELTELNVAFSKNRVELKNTNAELSKLEKEQKKLNAVMKDSEATEEQKQEYEELQKKIDGLILKKATLMTKEQELKGHISNVTSELKRQNTAVQATKDSLVNFTITETTANRTIGETKLQLNSLKNAFTKNQQEIKKTSSEIDKLEKEQRKLNAVMNGNTATEKQKQEYAGLQKKIDALIFKKTALKEKEQELKGQISSTTSELKKQNNAIQSTRDTYTKLVTALKGIAVGYAGKTLFQALIGGNAEIEQYITSFSVMLGDAEKAKALIQDLTDFSSRTPLTFESVAGTAQTLMGYGIQQDEMISTLEKLGNLAQGDAEKLNSVALAYAQMTAAGKVNLQDLKQMINAGVPILNGLSESMGKSVGEVQSLVSAGKVGINDLNKAINDMTTGSGQFAGMLEAQSQTMTGMLSTLKDKVNIFARQTGEEAFNSIKGELDNVLKMIEQAEKDGTLKEKAAEIGAMLKNIAVGLFNVGKFLLEHKETVISVATAYMSFKAAISIFNIISALVTSIKTLTNATERAEAAQKALNGTQAANPYVLLASVLISVTAGVWAYAASVETTTKKLDKMSQTMAELKERTAEAETAFEAEASKIKILQEKYDGLRNKTNLTAEEKKGLKAVAGELNTALGGNVKYIDDLTGAYKDLSGEIDTYIAKMHEETVLNAKKEEYVEAIKQVEQLKKTYSEFSDYQIEMADKIKPDEAQKIINGDWLANANYGKFGEVLKVRDQIKQNEQLIAEYKQQYGDYLEKFVIGTGEQSKALTDIEEQTNELVQATADLQSKYELLTSTQNEFNSSGKISSSTLQSIAEKYPELEKFVEAYITGLIDEKKLLSELQNAYKTDEQNFKTLTANKTAAETTLYNNLIGINGNLINNLAEQYKVDLSNYKNFADSKLAIGKAMLSQLAASYAEFYDLESDSLINETYDPTEPGATPDFIYDAEYKKTVEAVYKWRELSSKLEAEYKSANLNFVGADGYKPLYSTYKPYTSSNGSSSNSSSTSSESSSAKKTLTIYEKANAAFKKLVQDRVAEIEKLTKAEQDAADKRIAAIDEEIAARKRLAEDSSLQKQIDAVRAELKYSQLDDFSRMELEKNLNKLLDEQKETQWQRQKESEKQAIQSALDKKVIDYNTLKDKIKAAESQANLIFSDLQNGYKSAQSIVNNNSTSANINIVNQALTEGQVRKIVRDELGVVL